MINCQEEQRMLFIGALREKHTPAIGGLMLALPPDM